MKIVLEPQNDIWMDNAIVNFCELTSAIGAAVFKTPSKITIDVPDSDKFAEELSQEILRRTVPNLIVDDEDRKTKAKKQVKKDHILIQENKKIGGEVSLKEKIYDKNESREILVDILESLEGDSKRCVFCGRYFKKNVKNLQQASYPFVTKIKSLSGVRGLSDYFKDYCPLCYLIGVLEWLDGSMIYRTFPADKSYLFLPMMNDLVSLNEFKQYYIDLLGTDRYSNIKNPPMDGPEYTPGKCSTLLYFYEKFFEKISGDGDVCSECGKWGVIEIPLSGSVKNPKLNTINIPDHIMGLVRSMVKNDYAPYTEFIRNTNLLKLEGGVDFDETRIFREKISEAIINDDFGSFSRPFLPRKKKRIIMRKEAYEVLEELLWQWRCKPMGIKKEDLDTIKSVGNIVAAITKKNVGLLYKLDKARNSKEFWSVMREISRKLVGMDKNDVIKSKIKVTSLDNLVQLVKINEDDWKEARDLLIIYSSMYYSIRTLKQGE